MHYTSQDGNRVTTSDPNENTTHEPISVLDLVSSDDAFSHVKRFRCAKCHERVTADTTFSRLSDGSPVCGACSIYCDQCKLPILDEVMMTGDKSYHATCFNCRSCSKQIQGLVFARGRDSIYCMNCYNERMAHSRRYAGAKKDKSRTGGSSPHTLKGSRKGTSSRDTDRSKEVPPSPPSPPTELPPKDTGDLPDSKTSKAPASKQPVIGMHPDPVMEEAFDEQVSQQNSTTKVDEPISVYDFVNFAEKHIPDLEQETKDEKVYTWKLSRWKQLDRKLFSPEFSCGGHRWRILLFPFGNSNSPPHDFVSIYLDYADRKSAPEGWHVCAQFALVVSNPSDSTRYETRVAIHRFTASEPDWGWTRFHDLHQLIFTRGDEKPIIEDEECMISVYVRVYEDPTGALSPIKDEKPRTQEAEIIHRNSQKTQPPQTITCHNNPPALLPSPPPKTRSSITGEPPGPKSLKAPLSKQSLIPADPLPPSRELPQSTNKPFPSSRSGRMLDSIRHELVQRLAGSDERSSTTLSTPGRTHDQQTDVHMNDGPLNTASHDNTGIPEVASLSITQAPPSKTAPSYATSQGEPDPSLFFAARCPTPPSLRASRDSHDDSNRPSSLQRTTGRVQGSPESPTNFPRSKLSYPMGKTLAELKASNRTPIPGEGWDDFIPFDRRFIGKYKRTTTEPHAYGGFSDVWVCDALLSDNSVQKVATKELRAVNIPRAKANPEYTFKRMITRLQREIMVWSRLDHPRIVPLIGFRMEPTRLLISPWYSNGNVKDWVANHPEVDKRKFMWQIADGLVYLHSREPPIVHGDIKSDNVLITDEGNVVINDFGLSQIIEDVSSESTNTNSTAIVGNARWLAPEIFLDGEKRSMASDIYAFGCLLLEIATRALPFRGLQDRQVARALMAFTPPASDRAVYPELPKNDPLWDLMMDCWITEQEERPSMMWLESRLRD